MNIVNKVTWKCMCQNKKRTIVTIIGVIICVSMLSAISVIATSFQDVMLRSAIETNGSYEVNMQGVTQDKATRLLNDQKVKLGMRMSQVGEVSLVDAGYSTQGGFRSTLQMIAADLEHPELYAIKLLEGSMPQKSNEIVLCKEMMNHENFPHVVGDQIELHAIRSETSVSSQDPEVYEEITIDQGVQTYIITGIVSCDGLMASQSGYIGFTDFTSTTNKSNTSDVVFSLQNTDDFTSQVDDLNELCEPSRMSVNNTFLIYNGVDTVGVLSSYIVVVAVLMIIILIGSVSLIYNAFSISLSERSRYLGMLSSVGATKKQKRDSVFFEAFVIGSIAIPLGLLAGIVGMAVTFQFLNPYMAGMFDISNVSLKVVIDWRLMSFFIAFSIIILLVSAWIPAMRASRITAISAIRQAQDFSIRSKDVKTSKLTRKFFGVEAELGLKNMKRNHSRYVSTLSSLIICIILFMTAQFFSTTMKSSVAMMQSSEDADIIIDFYQHEESTLTSDDTFLNSLLNHPGVDRSTYYSKLDTFKLGDATVVTKETQASLLKQYEGYSEEELKDFEVETKPRVIIQILSDQDFKTYSDHIGLDASSMKQDQPAVIVVNQRTVIEYEEDKRVYRDLTLLELDETKPLMLYDTYYDEQLNETVNEKELSFSIAKVTNQLPSVNTNNANQAEVILVMDKENYAKLQDMMKQTYHEVPRAWYHVQLQSEQAETVGTELTEIVIGSQEYAGSVNNVALNRLKSEQQTVFISTLLYGFVTLILLICTANIVNSISTSVNLRKREFAMIKSIGITKRKFNRMICFETLFYGVKACVYGIPLGLLAMIFIFKSMGGSFIFEFIIQWELYVMMIGGVFLVLSLTMMYAVHKIRKDNIVETIRSESI